MGLVIPGLTPDTLGEIYEYFPTWNELAVSAGVFATGSLVFTVLVKVAAPIMVGAAQEHATEGEGPAHEAHP
jgi:molybdopterin-containing oxidoreductase family membrane subunit